MNLCIWFTVLTSTSAMSVKLKTKKKKTFWTYRSDLIWITPKTNEKGIQLLHTRHRNIRQQMFSPWGQPLAERDIYLSLYTWTSGAYWETVTHPSTGIWLAATYNNNNNLYWTTTWNMRIAKVDKTHTGQLAKDTPLTQNEKCQCTSWWPDDQIGYESSVSETRLLSLSL